MGFIKRHYEKILLSLVLVGLCAAAAWLPMSINKVRGEIDIPMQTAPKPTPLPALPELPAMKQAAVDAANPPPVVISGAHNLFNPVTWKLMPSGDLRKFTVEGSGALQVRKITPQWTVISFDRAQGVSLTISAQQHSSGQRAGTAEYLRVGYTNKSKLFTVKEVVGPVDNPTAVVLEVAGEAQPVTVQVSNSWKKVDGYTADLFYPLDNTSFTGKSANNGNNTFKLGEDTYKIIAITKDTVKVSSTTGGEATIQWPGAVSDK